MKNLISRILVAVDGSVESMTAATHAITIARIYDAELFTLTIINTQPWFHSSTLYGWADDQTIEKVYAKDTNESQRWADQIMDNAKVNGIKVISKKMLLGSTALGVLTYAHCPVMIVK
jgi:nucleotide-binding universal stress UspA family protein